METKKIKFLLADDHSMIRQGLEFLIEDLEIDHEINHASNLSQIVEKINTQSIDFLIIDAHFPDGNSLSILPKLKDEFPRLKILVFSGLEEHQYALKFLNVGVNGFLSKLSEEEEIKKAITKVLEEDKYISETTQDLLLSSVINPMTNPLKKLTDRELEIANLYAQGLGNLEIANRLDVKQNTISTVKKRIFEKLSVDNIVGLAELLKEYR